jgi:hypothetical protein
LAANPVDRERCAIASGRRAFYKGRFVDAAFFIRRAIQELRAAERISKDEYKGWFTTRIAHLKDIEKRVREEEANQLGS